MHRVAYRHDTPSSTSRWRAHSVTLVLPPHLAPSATGLGSSSAEDSMGLVALSQAKA